MLENLEDERLGARLGDVRAKTQIAMLGGAQAHNGNEKLGHTINHVEAKALFYKLARTQ